MSVWRSIGKPRQLGGTVCDRNYEIGLAARWAGWIVAEIGSKVAIGWAGLSGGIAPAKIRPAIGLAASWDVATCYPR